MVTCGVPRDGVVWWSFDEALHRIMLKRKILNKVGDLGILTVLDNGP